MVRALIAGRSPSALGWERVEEQAAEDEQRPEAAAWLYLYVGPSPTFAGDGLGSAPAWYSGVDTCCPRAQRARDVAPLAEHLVCSRLQDCVVPVSVLIRSLDLLVCVIVPRLLALWKSRHRV